MNMNVFSFPYRKKYYITHPFAFLYDLKLNFKLAWDRVVKGYCATDVYNMDRWMLEVLPSMLRELSEDCGYPDNFKSKENWENWLRPIADKMESCKEENRNKNNEYYNEWRWLDASEEVIKKYYARDIELYEEAQNNIKEALASLAEHFFDLWS